MESDERYYLKLKAAYYYYKEGMTQEVLAKMLNISRPTLSKYLKEAREEGIVEIKINDIRNQSDLLDLEIKIKNKYNLQDIRIVRCINDQESEVRKKLGETAAAYFERILKSGMRIGVSWGKTLEMMANYLQENKSIKNLELVTLLGGSVSLDSTVHANVLSQKILNKYNGNGYFLYAPIIVDSTELFDALMRNREIIDILERAKNVDVALVGIGGPIEISTVLGTGYFQQEQIQELKRAGAVGDICSRFFDEQGRICDLDLNNRIIGINLEDLKTIKKVIAVAGGKNKILSILGALNGGYIDVLITDEGVARNLL